MARSYDLLFLAVTLNAVFFSVAIGVAVVYFAAKYRQGAKVDRSHPPLHGNMIEILWTVIPLIIALGLFAWSTSLYFAQVRVPKGAMEVHVVGKQWMWKLQQPSGRWENNQLHVPVGKPVLLTMTSEDVIHSFFVPAFRLKQDVIPGQFTQLWFTATEPGEYHLLCAEFCGTLHSTMRGTVYVMDPAAYEQWLREGNVKETSALVGGRLFRQHGCSGCHGANSSVRAPALEGIYGRPVPVQIPQPGVPLEKIEATTVLADTRYIHDSIVLPEQEVAAGYRPIMPTFKNRLSEEEIFQIISYIRSLSSVKPSGTGRQDNTNTLTPEDYKARTGFVPDNIKRITGGGNAPAGGNTPRGNRPGGGGAGGR